MKIRCTSGGRRVLCATQRLLSFLSFFIIAKLCLTVGVSKFRTARTLLSTSLRDKCTPSPRPKSLHTRKARQILLPRKREQLQQSQHLQIIVPEIYGLGPCSSIDDVPLGLMLKLVLDLAHSFSSFFHLSMPALPPCPHPSSLCGLIFPLCKVKHLLSYPFHFRPF